MAKKRIHTAYFDETGKRLPSVTTVISSLGWNKRALMHWAWKMGVDGLDYKKVSGEAADIGTIAHAMVQDFINRKMQDLDPQHVYSPELEEGKYAPEDVEKASVAFAAFEAWWEQHNIIPKATEMKLASNVHGYGGTLDFVCSLDDRPALVDFKTSKGVYPDHLIQLSAYQQLFAEAQGGRMLDLFLLRIDKETGIFEFYHYPHLGASWEVFQHLLAIHKLQKEIGG